ncbi:hypothetical protein LTR47_006923 [Exophiala xenobiotica]|nr:hypothetical protein LTR47_006923 [Exophiala xenobiotica]KAK5249274.1 hypothetical protein LTS06_005783 [Exophiala xenobiotica]KAK5326469.1 hypothetical protein LTR93_003331 [Exophiala xenobiotica]KAK5353158.1 hypothetical protein LTR61_003115 [Exophiala xenobiotica]KAK5379939.1 hypothetical protein LTR11_003567 [Exophiala xenobiotica]
MTSKEPGQGERSHDPVAHQERTQQEASIRRNPHPDFKSVESSRPPWSENGSLQFIQTRDPTWTWGQGGNDGGASLKNNHIEIDPYAEGRPPVYNYKLLISGITPRPIGFISTFSKDGSSANLAPYSYTNVVCHDPPIFTVGFAGSLDKAKDTLANLIDTGECVLNVISEHFVEAANATSVNSPYGVSEWDLTGLHPVPSARVRPARVKESIFATECKLVEVKEFESRATPGKKTGVLAILEGVNFWVREDAINEERNLIDPAVLRPISRLGGITYARVTEGFELLRPDYEKMKASGSLEDGIGSKSHSARQMDKL